MTAGPRESVLGLLIRVEAAVARLYSMDIGRPLVERGMLDHFQGPSGEVKELLGRLREETGEHLALLEETWKRQRPAQGRQVAGEGARCELPGQSFRKRVKKA